MLRDLSLRHLAAVQAIHREGSYRRAAAALGYSQAAITQQVATLERIIGAPLFDRPGGPRPVTLTDAGREVLALADEVLPAVGLLEARLTEMREGRRGRLSLGTFQSVSAHLLPQVLTQTRQQEPEVDIHLLESDDNAVLVEALVSGRLDATFLVGPITDARLDVSVACADAYVAVLPSRDDRDVVRLADLDGVPIIGHDRCVCHDAVDRGLQSLGIHASYIFRSNDNAGVQAMVRAGLGLAIMPMLSMALDDPGIRIVPIEPSLPDRSILLALRRGRPSPVALRFRERALAAGASVPAGPQRSVVQQRQAGAGARVARRPSGR